jgi:hypothetical protein
MASNDVQQKAAGGAPLLEPCCSICAPTVDVPAAITKLAVNAIIANFDIMLDSPRWRYLPNSANENDKQEQSSSG